jgi:hypothetical protein
MVDSISVVSVPIPNPAPAAAVEPKVDKRQWTAYWGLSLGPEVLQNPEIQAALQSQPGLKPLARIHSTLLYVGKKVANHPDEEIYRPHEGRRCILHISSFGCTGDALSLKVDNLSFEDVDDLTIKVGSMSITDAVAHDAVAHDAVVTELVPSHAIQQHVTIALKDGVKAVDSPKSFEHLQELSKPLQLVGTIKRFLY